MKLQGNAQVIILGCIVAVTVGIAIVGIVLLRVKLAESKDLREQARVDVLTPWPSLQMQVGDTRAYAIHFKNIGWVNPNAMLEGTPEASDSSDQRQLVDSIFQARLETRVIGRTGDDISLAARFRDISYSVNGQQVQQRELLSIPFRIEIQGQQFCFVSAHPHLPDHLAGIMFQLEDSLVSVAPDQPDLRKWMRSINTGNFSTEIACEREEGPQVAAHITFNTGTPHPNAAGVTRSVLNGTGRCLPHPTLWYQERSHSIRFQTKHQSAIVAEETASFSLRFQEANIPWEISAAELESALNSALPATSEPSATRNVTAPAALTNYKSLIAGGRIGDAEDALAQALRDNPEIAEALMLLAIEAEADMHLDRRLAIWRLIAESGSPQAQAALLKALNDPALPNIARYRALAHIIDLPQPSRETLQSVLDFYRATQHQSDQVSRELHTSALWAFGALGHRDKSPADQSDWVADQITIEVQRATTPEARQAALLALGNLGSQRALATVEPWFNDSDGNTRRAAYDALRRMPQEVAFPKLTELYATESDANLRGQLVQHLRESSPGQKLTEWAREQVGREEALAPQVELVHVLGKAQDKESLQRLYQRNPAREVKEVVLKYLTPSEALGK